MVRISREIVEYTFLESTSFTVIEPRFRVCDINQRRNHENEALYYYSQSDILSGKVALLTCHSYGNGSLDADVV